MHVFDLRQWNGFTQAGGNSTSPALVDRVAIHSASVGGASTLFVALKGNRADGHNFVEDAAKRGARYAIVDRSYDRLIPGCSLLKVADPLDALHQLAALYRKQLTTHIIAITGSYGKTVTKDLLTALLSARFSVSSSPESFNSQIGIPLSLLAIDPQSQFALIEVGVSRSNEMTRVAGLVDPDGVLITNIEDAHLSTMGSLKAIETEKKKLLAHVKPGSLIILPNTLSPCTVTCRPEGANLAYTIRLPDQRLLQGKLPATFAHLDRVLSQAVHAAWECGLSADDIARGLQDYTPQAMRLEMWTSPLGTTYINDCYCADPLSLESTLRILSQQQRPRRFLFGGFANGRADPAAFAHVAHSCRTASIDQLITPCKQTAQAVQEVAPNLTIHTPVDPATELRAMRGGTLLIKGAERASLDRLSETITEGIGPNRLLIHLDAIRKNIDHLRQHLPSTTQIMPMLKAQAYGTSAPALARFFHQIDIPRLGVAHVCEAVALRLAGIQCPIFSMHAAAYEVAQIVEWQLEPAVSARSFVEALEKEASQRQVTIKVHLHVDTGMTRLGCRYEEGLELAKRIAQSPSLTLLGVWSHLACADDPSQDRATKKQIDRFHAFLEQLEQAKIKVPLKHLANSSATLRFSLPACNLVRVGLALYGLHPSSATQNCIPLSPALTCTTRLTAIHTCRKGETVSYGRGYTITHDNARIGVIPLGYADGIRQCYSGNGAVLINGKRAPIVGTICMDFCMIDLSTIPEAKVNDPVLVFGQDYFGSSQPAEKFAASGEESVYQLISNLGSRIQRVLIYDGEARQAL